MLKTWQTLCLIRLTSRQSILHLDIEVAGVGAFAHLPSYTPINEDMRRISMVGLRIVPGMLQTVQRAEKRSVVLALQAFSGIHAILTYLGALLS